MLASSPGKSHYIELASGVLRRSLASQQACCRRDDPPGQPNPSPPKLTGDQAHAEVFMDGQSAQMPQIATIDPATAGVAAASLDWGVVPDPEVDEQFQKDLVEIAEAEKAADREAPLLRVF